MQQPKTINELMTTLVKRYNIATQVARPAANAVAELSRPRDSVQTAIPHDSTLGERIKQLERENSQQNEQLRRQEIALELKTKETKELKTQLSLKQKQFEQTLSEQMKRMRALQGHNQALQQELLSIKDLLREQQALIIQLNSSHDEE